MGFKIVDNGTILAQFDNTLHYIRVSATGSFTELYYKYSGANPEALTYFFDTITSSIDTLIDIQAGLIDKLIEKGVLTHEELVEIVDKEKKGVIVE